MLTLHEDIKSRMTDLTILDNSPVSESQSIGVAERAVRAVANQVRILGSALSTRVGINSPSPALHPVTMWLVTHAGDLLTKLQVSNDGKTGYERARGNKYNRGLVEFGERVYYRSGKLD